MPKLGERAHVNTGDGFEVSVGRMQNCTLIVKVLRCIAALPWAKDHSTDGWEVTRYNTNQANGIADRAHWARWASASPATRFLFSFFPLIKVSYYIIVDLYAMYAKLQQ
jgi:hypothetical protein